MDINDFLKAGPSDANANANPNLSLEIATMKQQLQMVLHDLAATTQILQTMSNMTILPLYKILYDNGLIKTKEDLIEAMKSNVDFVYEAVKDVPEIARGFEQMKNAVEVKADEIWYWLQNDDSQLKEIVAQEKQRIEEIKAKQASNIINPFGG